LLRAVSSNEHVAFQSVANAFLVAAHRKKPTQSNSFCEEWLLIGLMHAEGIKSGRSGYDLRKPDEMAKLAIAALKYTFGNEWQNHELVQGFFDTNKAYKTLPTRYRAPIRGGSAITIIAYYCNGSGLLMASRYP
jgi:hypothetical protein